MVEAMKEVNVIVERQNENVDLTERTFEDVQDRISKSIDGITEIANRTNDLDQSRGQLVSIVQTLATIARDNAVNTEQTTASVVEVGDTMTNVANNAEHMTNIANELEHTVELFTVE